MIMFLMPLVVKAETSSVSINCSPSQVSAGATSACLIKGSSDFNVSRVVIDITYDDDLMVSSYENATGFTGSLTNNKIDISRGTEDLANGNFNIGTLNMLVAASASVSSANITLSNVTFYDADGNDFPASSIGTVITIASGSNTGTGLKTLSVTNGTLSPALTATNYGYLVTLNSTSTTSFGISATANNSNDTITFVNGDTNATISNPQNITFVTTGGKSEMLVKINVGDETYTLTVTKPTVNSSNELSSLTVGEVNVTLASGKHDYEVGLKNVSSYEVNAVLKDSTKYRISNMTFPTTMNGATEFAIVIEPIDNTSGLSGVTYVIKVKKSASDSSAVATSDNTSSNPQTGGVAMTMALVLIASFSLSIYLYKKNIESYN